MPQYSEKVFSPYAKEDLFDLVLDIEKYPEFLPWCSNARITTRESKDVLYADLEISFKAFFYKYTSKIKINEIKNVKEHFLEIDVEMVNGPFRKLINKWRFDDADEDGSFISFSIDLELKSMFFNRILNMIFDHAYKKMLSAFEQRADQIHGKK